MDEKLKKAYQSSLDALTKAKETISWKRNEEDRRYIISKIGEDLVQILVPLLDQIVSNARISREEMKEIISQIQVAAPKVRVEPANITVESSKVPPIVVPEIRFPKEELIRAIREAIKGIKFPKEKQEKWEFPKEMKVAKMDSLIKNVEKLATAKLKLDMGGIDRDNPLPVILTDEDGVFYKAIAELIGTSGGVGIGSLNRTDDGYLQIYVAGATGTTAVNIVDSSGVAYSSSNPVPVSGFVRQVSGAMNSVYVSGYAACGDGTEMLDVVGERRRLSAASVPCRRVLVQAHESNTAEVVVGGATVVGALVGRRGVALFPTQTYEFKVSDLNMLYIDSTVGSSQVNYYYEN